MPDAYAFGTVTASLLIGLHQMAAPDADQGFNREKLEAVIDSDGSGYAFQGLDRDDPVHVGLFFARQVIDQHPFNDGNKRTATELFKHIVTMSGGSFRAPANQLPNLISQLYNLTTEEFTDFALAWPNG